MSKRVLQVAAILALAACASGDGAGRDGGMGAAGEPPVVLYRVAGRNGPHPVVRIPYQTARELGVIEPTFATPGMIERLEAECEESNRPALCRRELDACREKTCRIVPVY